MCACVCLKYVCVLFVVYGDVGWLDAVCECACWCSCAVFVNVCALFVNVLSGVVWFVCLDYSLCLCARLLLNACALYVVYCVML